MKQKECCILPISMIALITMTSATARESGPRQNAALSLTISMQTHWDACAAFVMRLYIWFILIPLAGKFSEDTQKKGKGAKTGASHDWRSFYLSQYDWLKGSHITKVVWLPNETDYSYCEFVVPNTPY